MDSLVQKISSCYHAQWLAAGELDSIALHSIGVDALEFSHICVDF